MSVFDRRWADGEAGLREMCDTGVEMLTSGDFLWFDTLRFDCFNLEEADYVAAYMAERYPTVPFFTTRVTPTAGKKVAACRGDRYARI